MQGLYVRLVRLERRRETAVLPGDDAADHLAAMALRRLIDSYFTETEIRGMALDLALDPEDLANDDKPTLVQALVVAAQHRGRLWDLVGLCRQLRPNVAWPQRSDTGPLPDWR